METSPRNGWGALRAARAGAAGAAAADEVEEHVARPAGFIFRRKLKETSVDDREGDVSKDLDDEPPPARHKRRVARWPVASFLLGTGIGQSIALLSLATCFILGGAAFWLVGRWPAEGGGWGAAGSFADALWTSYTFFVDPGKHAGLLPEDPSEKLGVAVACSFLGLVWMMVVFGLIVDSMRISLDAWRCRRARARTAARRSFEPWPPAASLLTRPCPGLVPLPPLTLSLRSRRHARTVLNDHVVVLGWTDKTLFLLGELAQMLTDGKARGGRIVVLGHIEDDDFREELDIAYPRRRRRWPRVRFYYRQGKPHEVDDLERVSIFAARHVIVLGTSRKPREADSLALSTVCVRARPRTAPPLGHAAPAARPIATARRAGAALPARRQGAAAVDDDRDRAPAAAERLRRAPARRRRRAHHRQVLDRQAARALDARLGRRPRAALPDVLRRRADRDRARAAAGRRERRAGRAAAHLRRGSAPIRARGADGRAPSGADACPGRRHGDRGHRAPTRARPPPHLSAPRHPPRPGG